MAFQFTMLDVAGATPAEMAVARGPKLPCVYSCGPLSVWYTGARPSGCVAVGSARAPPEPRVGKQHSWQAPVPHQKRRLSLWDRAPRDTRAPCHHRGWPPAIALSQVRWTSVRAGWSACSCRCGRRPLRPRLRAVSWAPRCGSAEDRTLASVSVLRLHFSARMRRRPPRSAVRWRTARP